MTGHRAAHCPGDNVQRPLLKEVERIGPGEYQDPRTGRVFIVVWNGIGPLPGQTQSSPRKRDPLLHVVGL